VFASWCQFEKKEGWCRLETAANEPDDKALRKQLEVVTSKQSTNYQVFLCKVLLGGTSRSEDQDLSFEITYY